MKKKFSRSLMLNKKSVASLAQTAQRQVVGGNDNKTNCETCEINCVPDTVVPSCEPTCWHSDCHCSMGDCFTDQQGWGICS
ncbi:class I lanthipeptide [Kordia sp.]|uniref:class I lanthipeptide n=1 Tax=Kordia sp. TaxID=1965332 RepID=UPI003D2D35DC